MCVLLDQSLLWFITVQQEALTLFIGERLVRIQHGSRHTWWFCWNNNVNYFNATLMLQSIMWCRRLNGTLWSRHSVGPMLTSPQTTWSISTGFWWATNSLLSSTTCSWDCLDKNHSKKPCRTMPSWVQFILYTWTQLIIHLNTHL